MSKRVVYCTTKQAKTKKMTTQNTPQMKLPQVSLEQQEKNINRTQKTTDNDECVCCKRPINNDGKFRVHMSTSWMMIHNDNNELDDNESQGTFPVGNSCSKKIPKEYKFKF